MTTNRLLKNPVDALLSEEHFTVDGTLIEAWASMKSFRKKDSDTNNINDDDPGNPSVDFRNIELETFKGHKNTDSSHIIQGYD